jgi:hypothetical protein
MRKQPTEFSILGCANCGRNSSSTAVDDELPYQITGAFGLLVFVGGLVSLAQERRLQDLLVFAVGLAMCSFGVWRWRFVGRRHQAQREVPFMLFNNLKQQSKILIDELKHLRELLQLEEGAGDGTIPSAHGIQRVELLKAALKNRSAQFLKLESERWTREVQLWLNQLEGFLVEELPQLDRSNGHRFLLDLSNLRSRADLLLEGVAVFGSLTTIPEQARKILLECLRRFPELEDRVKDARVLAALGDAPTLPELEAGGTWLHWLQEAIPTIATLPPEFHDDEAYFRLKAELRLLKEGHLPQRSSLDRTNQSAEEAGGFRTLE